MTSPIEWARFDAAHARNQFPRYEGKRGRDRDVPLTPSAAGSRGLRRAIDPSHGASYHRLAGRSSAAGRRTPEAHVRSPNAGCRERPRSALEADR